MDENKNYTLKLIESIEKTVEQMKLDDIVNSPDSAQELFQCSCCGQVTALAGSMIYGSELYCNNCVLLTESCLALNKIKFPEEMIDLMENKRFENIYNSIFELPDVTEN